MLLPGTEPLINELIDRLRAGEAFDNPALLAAADQHFGGSIAAGTYQCTDAYNAMETAVNRLVRLTAPEMMTGDFLAHLSILRALMRQLPTQNLRTIISTEFQTFSTPPTIAFLVARLASPLRDSLTLEPSAGTGSLAIWADAMGSKVLCNEIDPKRRAILTDIFGFETTGYDGAIIHDRLPREISPEFIMMNPPFSATGGKVKKHDPMYGAQHIESALKRLKNGGRLVAISGQGMAFTGSAFSKWWQLIAQKYNVRANISLNGEEYQKYGTKFGLQIIVIDKVGPTPGSNWKGQTDNIIWGDAQSIEEAWQRLGELAEDLAPPEEETGNLFARYAPKRVVGGKAHPAPAVEANSMAAVDPPFITYRPHLPQRIIKDGSLTGLQAESVIYAGQRHEQRLGDGSRAGYVVGHGTGIGKGRIVTAIIGDNWFQGRKRAIWFSVSKDLHVAAQDDLDALGLNIPLVRINEYAAHEDITLPEGIIFCSYHSLIAESKQRDAEGEPLKRIDQITRWLGDDGVIIFDECHRAKNALAAGRGEPTQTGSAVIALQDPKEHPNYRVVYSSATDSTEVRNMVYMTRLGLWGPGTQFDSFIQFMIEVEDGGLGAMEMISRDMKALGMRLSASISFKGIEYRERVHMLTPQQRKMYDCAAAAWRVALQNIEDALEETNADKKARGRALNRFWGDNQRFFRLFICAIKVPTLIKVVEQALAEEQSVIISLVGTGEARTKERIAQALIEDGDINSLDFTPREILEKMILKAFPTILYEDIENPITGKISKVMVTDEETGKPVHSQEALDMKQRLLDSLTVLDLPDNPLDQIVNYFGENAIAEITGRARRLIRTSGQTEYKKRAGEGTPMDQVNIQEMQEFQAGKKRIAIISDAGALGISLHASKRCLNQQQRLLIAFELGWRADQQMQVFGRVHRSDQKWPPIYVLLSTECAGEIRFSSTIARRLGSLGALTKGDRSAADGGGLGKYNFETEEGRAALMLTFANIMKGEIVPDLPEPRQALRDIGLLRKNSDGVEEIRAQDETNVPRFLNRILALDIEHQNALFNYFATLFDQTVANAKAAGIFDEGVTDISALAIRMRQAPRIIAFDRVTGSKTSHYVIETDQPSGAVPFDDALAAYQMHQDARFYQQFGTGAFFLTVPSRRQTNAKEGSVQQSYAIWRPDGARVDYLDALDLQRRTQYGQMMYQRVEPSEARDWWTQAFNRIPPVQTTDMHILGGAILPIWQRLKVKDGAKLRVVRVSTEDGQRIVGVLIPKKNLQIVLREIGVGYNPESPEQCFSAVLYEGVSIDLTDGLRLKPAFLHSKPSIELTNVHYGQFPSLRKMGFLNESIRGKQRFYVPSDPTTGIDVLTRLLQVYSLLVEESEDGESESTAMAIDIPETTTPGQEVVDLATWLIEPEGEASAPAPPLPVIDYPAEVAEVIVTIREWKPGEQASLFEM